MSALLRSAAEGDLNSPSPTEGCAARLWELPALGRAGVEGSEVSVQPNGDGFAPHGGGFRVLSATAAPYLFGGC